MSITIRKSRSASTIKTIFIVFIIIESSHLVSQLLGIDKGLSRMLFSAFMLGGFLLSMFLVAIKLRGGESVLFYCPALIVITVFFVSMISGVVIFPKPISDWLPSIYAFFPIFSFYIFFLMRVSQKELATSFIIVAVLISVMLLVDSYSRIDLLDEYFRLSIYDKFNRRVVILKNEVILGIVMMASLLFSKRLEPSKSMLLIVFLFFCFTVQFQVMESRLSFTAFIVALAAILYLNKAKNKTIAFVIIGGAAGMLFLPSFLLGKGQVLSSAMNMGAGGNISVRIDTVIFLKEIFYASYGIGVGMMSPTGNINNILHSDSRFNFYDGGVYASIAQFGVIGLYVWYKLTFGGLKILHKAYSSPPKDEGYIPIAIMAFILGFTITPLPLNLFLQPWTIFTGGVIIYFIWLSSLKIECAPHAIPK